MIASKEYVKRELEAEKERRKLYQSELKRLPKGKLYISDVKGNSYFYMRRDGRKHYLGKEARKEIEQLQQRRLLESAVKNIDANIPLMEKFVVDYKETGLENLLKNMPKAYQMKSSNAAPFADFINVEEWEKQPYNRNARHKEELRHKTLKGDFVRSKSEVILANILTSRNIAYHYEEIEKINGVLVAPDFKIAVESESKFRLLEHCGMIGDENYRNTFLWKLRNYIEGGYLPWRDVIFTFDDMDGSIDTQSIHKLVDFFFI